MNTIATDNSLIDSRIKPMYWFYGVIYTTSIFLLATAPIAVGAMLILSVLITAYYAAYFLCVRYIADDFLAYILFTIISVFFSIAYILKFTLILHNPSLTWNVRNVLGDEYSVLADMPIKMVLLLPAFCLFFIGYSLAPKITTDKSDNRSKSKPVNTTLLVLTGLGILIVKAVSQYFFNVGSPTLFATGLPPLIAAGLEFFVQDTAIVLLNILFIYALRFRSKTLAKVIGVFLFLNVLMSLSVGVKYEMVAQTFALIYYYYEYKSRMRTFSWKKFAITGTTVVFLMLLIYPYINPLRHMLKGNVTRAEAVSLAIEHSKYESVESATGISLLFARVSGIGTYYASLRLGEGSSFGTEAFFQNTISQHLKYQAFGSLADTIRVGFGGSQFAALMLIGGPALLYIGSLAYGFLIRGISSILLNLATPSVYARIAFAPFLSFFWISFLLAGGNWPFYVKKMFVIITCAFITHKLITK